MRLITPFDPWKSKLCSCPQKYSLSPYTGCSHGCLYCYASSYIKNFYPSRPKKNFLKQLEKEIKKLPFSSYITIANSSDPYPPQEEKLRLTRATLEILKREEERLDLRLMLVTKSSLILKDFDILKEFKRIVVSISITTLDEKLAKMLEPSAPSPYKRLDALRKLSKYLPVVCRVDPLIYPLNTENLEIIVKKIKECGAKQIITSTYKVRPDNFQRMVKRFPQYRKLWQDLYMKKGERISGYIYLPLELRKKLISRLREICLKERLEFSSCREGLTQLNTTICDGSAFFND